MECKWKQRSINYSKTNFIICPSGPCGIDRGWTVDYKNVPLNYLPQLQLSKDLKPLTSSNRFQLKLIEQSASFVGVEGCKSLGELLLTRPILLWISVSIFEFPCTTVQSDVVRRNTKQFFLTLSIHFYLTNNVYWVDRAMVLANAMRKPSRTLFLTF